jgi:membrane-bound ClpP family serine protease
VAEIFLIPGVGVFGFGGGLLILTSLILATQTFVIPRNDYQFQQLSYSLSMVLATMAGMGVGMFVLRKYIDTAPILKHVLLNPPTGDELEERQQREAIVDYSHLLNCEGTTTTPVAPSGKAQFGKELVDVISDGEFLSRGAQVKVIDVQGNRVLIEPMEST